MTEQFVPHIKKIFWLAKDTINGPALTEETGLVNVKGDRSIGMDIRLEELVINYIQTNNLPVNIFSEEKGNISFHPDPQYLIAFDPLDGSTNYKLGKNLLPFGLLMAVYEGLNPRLQNVVAAGAIEFTRNLSWVFDGQTTTDKYGTPVVIDQNWQINRSTPVYLDLFYKQAYDFYRLLAEQVFIRNSGSTIGNLSCVLSNVASGMGAIGMRAEEIGAVYGLIKGAKGITVDHYGDDLGQRNFHSDYTYPILAGSKNFIEFCASKLQRLP